MSSDDRFWEKFFRVFGQDVWDLEDLKLLAYTDLSDLDPDLRWEIDQEVSRFIQYYGEPWDDRDPKYPDNTFLYGYETFNHLFILGYSGVAGAYWNSPDCWTVCKPY